MLRCLSARYLGVDPETIQFEYGRMGKPRIKASSKTSRLEFSASHSGDLIVQAFTRGRRIGVDVEHLLDDFPWSSIEDLSFTPRERFALSGLPRNVRGGVRFAIWTRKESYLKATGEGIGQISEMDLPTALPGALWGLSVPSVDSCWRLYDLQIQSSYQAALVVEGPIPLIRLQRLDANNMHLEWDA
jgi:4'-phosphopantetheinyl transferase